jgi:uncharacterized protein (DUF486 family)
LQRAYLGRKFNLSHLIGFVCIAPGARFIFKGAIPVR